MAYCIPKDKVMAFKQALRSGEINPQSLADMESSLARRNYLAKFVGEKDAMSVNALFESKLLLKNQRAGMIAWARKTAGLSPTLKKDIIQKIEGLSEVLNPESEKAFLSDLAAQKLGMGITSEEGEIISNITSKITEAKSKANADGVFPSENSRLEYGINKVNLENYINEVKLASEKLNLREHKIKIAGKILTEIPGTLKSTVASMDNSFWGRQGLSVAYTQPRIWTRNFIKSWGDMVKQLTARGNILGSGDDAVLNAIKADIYSRPNAVTGKYKAGGYGLEVMSEEAYPSSAPEKIPVLGRLFKTSEVLYNGAALRLRADLADRYIKLAEMNGVNTLNPEEAIPIGHLVSTLTGRGNLGVFEMAAKPLNAVAFSAKFLKSRFDILTMGMTDQKIRNNPFARKEAAKATLKIIGTVATILTTAKLIDPESVEEDPRSSNFGKIKISGKWVDITGGTAGILTAAARITPTRHEGKLSLWKKNADGSYTDLWSGEFGKQNGLDIVENFVEGKFSPMAGIMRDIWTSTDYSGNPVTAKSILENQLPISLQTWNQLKTDPSTSNAFGLTVIDMLGLSVSSTITPNSKSKDIPEGKRTKNEDLIKIVSTYAKAFGTDPETAFNRLFTGQRIRRVDNGTIIVERMPLKDSQEIKKKAGADNPLMKLDHTIPLELGGSNDPSNLKLVTTSEWSSYTKTENALGTALQEGRITKAEAQKYVKEMKDYKDSGNRTNFSDNLIKKLQALPKKSSFNLVKPVMASEFSAKLTQEQRRKVDENNKRVDQINSILKSNLLSPIPPATLQAEAKKLRNESIIMLGGQPESDYVPEKLTPEPPKINDKYKGKELTVVEKPVVETFDNNQVPREVAFGIMQAEGGKINRFNLGATDKNPKGAIKFKDQASEATAAAQFLSGQAPVTMYGNRQKGKEAFAKAWSNRSDPVKMLEIIQNEGKYAGDPATWKKRSIEQDPKNGAGLYYDSWMDYIMHTSSWNRWF